MTGARNGPGTRRVEELFARPWRERRLIVAVEDESELAQHQLGQPGSSGAKKPTVFLFDHQDEKGKAAEVVGRAVVGYATLGLSEVAIFGAKGAKHLLDKRRQGKQPQTPVKFIPIAISDLDYAADRGIVHLPSGGFDFNVAYAGHPHVGYPREEAAIYEPVADFHRFLFEDKAAELSGILAALGATWYSVTHTTKGQRGKGVMAGLNMAVIEKQLKIDSQATEGSRVCWEVRLAPDRPPYLPDNLVWYPHERSWQHVVDMRFNSTVTDLRVSLEYRRDYQINSEVAMALEGLGISLGGKFINYEEVVWEIEGEYAPKHALEG